MKKNIIFDKFAQIIIDWNLSKKEIEKVFLIKENLYAIHYYLHIIFDEKNANEWIRKYNVMHDMSALDFILMNIENVKIVETYLKRQATS
jgi:hypothetical protein